MERSIADVRKLRVLNESEIHILNEALTLYAETERSHRSVLAKSMLEQKMPENFLWAD